MSMNEAASKSDLAEVDAFDDGYHHLWCRTCHPEWVTRPLGADLGAPFIAWCGVPAVILVRHQSDDIPPYACPACAAPATRCSVCGAA